MTLTITVANQKGGVGKTTTAVQIAHGLTTKGKKILLVDLDPQGQCAAVLGLKSEPGVFNLLVAEMTARQVIRSTDRQNLFVILGDNKSTTAQTILSIQRMPVSTIRDKIVVPARSESFDYVLIDTSPSVGELQEQALWASDGVLLPCAVDYLAFDGALNIASTLERLRAEFKWGGEILGVLPTFYDHVTRESKATLKDLEKHFGRQLLAPIHRATILRECAVEGKTIFELSPSSRAAREYEELVKTVLDWSNK